MASLESPFFRRRFHPPIRPKATRHPRLRLNPPPVRRIRLRLRKHLQHLRARNRTPRREVAQPDDRLSAPFGQERLGGKCRRNWGGETCRTTVRKRMEASTGSATGKASLPETAGLKSPSGPIGAALQRAQFIDPERPLSPRFPMKAGGPGRFDSGLPGRPP